MLWLLTALVLLIIALVGHYGLPEKINADDFQQEPVKDRIIPGAESFRLEGDGEVAFLMVHGFEGSPFTLKSLGETLHSEGYTVIAPLLPGHGTNVKEFTKTRYEHWYRKVEQIYQAERKRYKHFFILGFSMGGNLSLKLASQFSRNLPCTGLILLSTPVALNGLINGKVLFKDWRLSLSGIIKYFVPFIKKIGSGAEAERLNPWVGYSDYYTTACVHSFKVNIPRVRKHLNKIKCPACLIQATNDRTISDENLYYILNEIESKEKRSFLFSIDEDVSTRHVLITHEQTKEKVFHYVLEFINDTLVDFKLVPDRKKKPGLLARIFRRKKLELA